MRITVALAAGLALSLLSQFQATAPPGVTPGAVDAATAKANRKAIEAGLLGGATFKLPAGDVWVDQSLNLDPRYSGSTLVGKGPVTVLRNKFATANGVNNTLLMTGGGVTYIANSTPAPEGDGVVLDPTVAGTGLPWDDPSAQPELLKPGNTAYLFTYDSYLSQNPPPRQRYVIKKFVADTRKVTFDRPPDPNLHAVKWLDGTPVADVKSGSRTVTLLDPAQAAGFPQGRRVYLTSGPSVANSSVGEHMTVVYADATTGLVTLDRPAGRDYTLAALARVSVLSNFTLKDLTVGQPAHPQGLCLQAGMVCDCNFDSVNFQAPSDPGFTPTGINSCGRLTFLDCNLLGTLSFNSCHDCTVNGGVYATIIGEEASTRCSVMNCTVRLNPVQAGQALNGIGWGIGSDRLTVTKTRIEGFGVAIPNGGAMSPVYGGGPGLVLRDVTITGVYATVNSGSWLNAEGGKISRLNSNIPIFINGGKGWSVTDSAALSWNLFGGTGIMSGCSPQPQAAAGWVVKP